MSTKYTVYRVEACSGAGDTGTPRAPRKIRGGRLRSIRGIRGLGDWTLQGHRGAGAHREVMLREDSISENALSLRHSAA